MKKITRDVKVERYYPDVLSPAKEMKAIAQAENLEYGLLYDEAWAWFANTFVYDASEKGIARWETMLGIIPLPGESLLDRRREILFRINNRTPYTERTLKQMYDMMYGEDSIFPEVRESLYTLALHLTGDAIWEAKKVKIYARCIVPANLIILTSRNLGTHQIEFHAAGIARNYKYLHVEMSSSAHLEVEDSTAYVAGAVVHNYKKLSVIGED